MMSLFRQSIILFRHFGPQLRHTNYAVRNIQRWVAPTLRELEKRKKKMGPQLPDPRSQYLEWNYDAEIYAFAKRLGETFQDTLLRQAFRHRTYIIQQELKEGKETDLEDNKKLIELGEELISDCIRTKLEKQYSTDLLEAIVQYLTTEEMLAHVASHMGVTDLVLTSEFPVEKNTLARTFKAIVGALKESTNTERTAEFVNDFLICQLNGKDIYNIWNLKNPYEYLLKLLQNTNYKEVEARLCNQSATNTILANYQVGLYSEKKLLGIGWGESVEIAKDTAALDAIHRIQKNGFKRKEINS